MVRNWGPVSKKPQRSQTDSKEQSSPTGRVQVTVPQETPVLGGDAAHVGAFDAGRERFAAFITGLDGLSHPEVLLATVPVRDAGIGQGHAHGAVSQQRGDRLEAHAPVDQPGGQVWRSWWGWT